MRRSHNDSHKLGTAGWLRAAVLGASDGIVSNSSLCLGLAAAHTSHVNLLLSGGAAVVAGAMSMATGEYVSVHSQADTEAAALAQERAELRDDFQGERRELADIYVRRGLDKILAGKVAQQLMAHDALGSHARDELGLSPTMSAKPLQAAMASAGSFSMGALLPVAVVAIAPAPYLIAAVASAALVCLLLIGGWSARVGGANARVAALRVAFWSGLAMTVTTAFGAAVGAL
jgi:vacuolar iron transporter family protein